MTKPETLADRVRLALAQEGTLRELAARLDIPENDYDARQQVRFTLRDLMRHGEATFEGVPRRYCRIGGPSRRGEMQAKLWRFLKVKAVQAEYATVKEASRFSEASMDYAKRYLRWLDEIEAVDTIKGRNNARRYRLADGWGDQPAPRWNRRAQRRRLQEGAADACVDCTAKIGGVLGEMRRTLTAISGEAELVLGMVNELEAGLPGFRQQSEAGDGTEDHHES